MIHRSRFAFNTHTMGGALNRKVNAIRGAGFSSLELWASDLSEFAGGTRKASDTIRMSGLNVANYKLLRDFEGSSALNKELKLQELELIVEQMRNTRTDLLVVCANAAEECFCDESLFVSDLTALANVAGAEGIRLAYEALPWSRHINTLAKASSLVERVASPYLGIVVDTFQCVLQGTTPAEVAAMAPSSIFLVQVSDYIKEGLDALTLARHHRVFPGEGAHDVAGLLVEIEATGYAGDYTLEVYNDDYRTEDPFDIAERAMRSVEWVQKYTNGVPA
jgi:4-hydroxyphenylpyruvate dioxygenase